MIGARLHAALPEAPDLGARARVALYALVAGRRPERVLHLGTAGTACVLACAALDDLGAGRVAVVDPRPWPDEEVQAVGRPRADAIGRLPAGGGIAAAAEALGGRFDLVLLARDAAEALRVRELEVALPWLAAEAALLDVAAGRDGAVDRLLAAHPGALADAGAVAPGLRLVVRT